MSPSSTRRSWRSGSGWTWNPTRTANRSSSRSRAMMKPRSRSARLATSMHESGTTCPAAHASRRRARAHGGRISRQRQGPWRVESPARSAFSCRPSSDWSSRCRSADSAERTGRARAHARSLIARAYLPSASNSSMSLLSGSVLPCPGRVLPLRHSPIFRRTRKCGVLGSVASGP